MIENTIIKKAMLVSGFLLTLLLGTTQCSDNDRSNVGYDNRDGTDNKADPKDPKDNDDGEEDQENSTNDSEDWENEGSSGDTGSTTPEVVASYIWIANTEGGTLSKVDTRTVKEVARYRTCPYGRGCDPSRTSVNMHGDMVVTNRETSGGPSSVTKFAGSIDDCKDRNGNNSIETSNGPNDVLPFNQDECMLWNSPIGGNLPGTSTGARATAWDGREDPETGIGGHVFIGSTISNKVWKLNGDTGAVIAKKSINAGAYGGAVDGKEKGSFWIITMECVVFSAWPGFGPQSCPLLQVDMETLAVTRHPIKCGYGITIDSKGRVWTAGIMQCIGRYDPATDTYEHKQIQGAGRGIAADNNGHVWAALTEGQVIQIDEDSLQIVKKFDVGQPDMIGVAVDYDGFIWAVSQGSNKAHKIDPQTYTSEVVTIGLAPYTYSDMTGTQLRGVVAPVL